MTFFYSIVGLLALLGILVTFHEWGHYWVAKKLGVKALRFSVGFGKPIWSKFNKAGTEFAIAPIPLGGYVKFVDEREGPVAEEDLPYAFNRQPVWKRILIVLAGPLANFLLAITVYAAVYMVGINVSKPFVSEVKAGSIAAMSGFPQNSEIVSVDGKNMLSTEDFVFTMIDKIGSQQTVSIELIPLGQSLQTIELDITHWKESEEGNVFEHLGLSFSRVYTLAQVGAVSDDSPAQQTGLEVGDRILEINGVSISHWSEISTALQGTENQSIPIKILRNKSEIGLYITPQMTEIGGIRQARIGIGPDYFKKYNTIHYGFFDAIVKGTEQTWLMIERITSFLGKLFTGKLSVKNLGGPLGIAQGAGQTVQAGMVAFLLYLAMISVNLGFVNLLQIGRASCRER